MSSSSFLIICLFAAVSSHSFGNNHILSESDNFLFEDTSSSGLSLCLPSYEISEGSIIRTKDSQELGAHFINETDLGVHGRDECLRLCCRTPHCNVAIFEEKNSGSCYMFDCGSTEDFRCKFTSQIHYTSAILRRKEIQPSQTAGSANKLLHADGNNQHEAELNQLRSQMAEIDIKGNGNANINKNNNEPVVFSKAGNDGGTITNAGGILTSTNKNKVITPTPVSLGILDSSSGSRRCSRWQFECKSSGECIAIYNACDGIPNCEDASDEGPELHCPSGLGSGISNNALSKDIGQISSTSLGLGYPVDKGRKMTGINHDLSNAAGPMSPVDLMTVKDHIFNHKSGGIMEETYGNQLQQQKHNGNPSWNQHQTSYDYNNQEQLPNSGFGTGPGPQSLPNGLYGNNYGSGGGYPFAPGYQGQGPQSQQGGTGLIPQIPQRYNIGPNAYNVPNSPELQHPYYGNSPNPLPNPTLMNGINKAQLPQQSQNSAFMTPSRFSIPSDSNNNVQGSPQVLANPPGQGNSTPKSPVTVTPITDVKSSNTVTSSAPNTVPLSGGKIEIDKTPEASTKDGIAKVDFEAKLEDEILHSLKNQPYNSETAAVQLEELSPHKAGPGAFLLFIIGLGMSISMATIVGCRLRRVGTRRRRKNRLDPDYLVDGMYL